MRDIIGTPKIGESAIEFIEISEEFRKNEFK